MEPLAQEQVSGPGPVGIARYRVRAPVGAGSGHAVIAGIEGQYSRTSRYVGPLGIGQVSNVHDVGPAV